MKILYIECAMGAAGDMLTAALLGLFPAEQRENILAELNAIGVPNVVTEAKIVTRQGISGTLIDVLIGGTPEHVHDYPEHERKSSKYVLIKKKSEHIAVKPHSHEHHHAHGSVSEIYAIIDSLHVSDAVKAHSKAVYGEIANAESAAHGVPVADIHFHEVGMLDAVADVVNVCCLLERIAAGKIVVSPVAVGSGFVRAAHGVLPVPAPATAHILRGAPTYPGEVRGELCTPTGAALLKHFAAEFGSMPPMSVSEVGYGMGHKDFPGHPNCVRVFLGETENVHAVQKSENVAELHCEVDDMTGEALGFAAEKLLAAGALDVYFTPIFMKKNRPAQLITVLCKENDIEMFANLLLVNTTTFGVRFALWERRILDREFVVVNGEYGSVKAKIGRLQGTPDILRQKLEYDEIAELARKNDLPLQKVVDSFSFGEIENV